MAESHKITFERDSAFGYIVHYDDYPIGHVGGGDRQWYAKTDDFDLGEHKTRRDAVAALVDIYLT